MLIEVIPSSTKRLPEDVRRDLEECTRDEDFSSDKYKKACEVFYQRHVCRLDPFPADLMASLNHIEEDPTVYLTM